MGFYIGQKWFSESETEIGSGEVISVEERTFTVYFGKVDEKRSYSKENSVLKRVVFKAGDKVNLKNGGVIKIKQVDNSSNVISYYNTEEEKFSESDTAFDIPAPGIISRLKEAAFSTKDEYLLKSKALALLNDIEHCPNRGLLGNRIEHIPHQLYLARKITSNHRIRVLLADEVGLGKTIEACLILNRALTLGLVKRVIIAVPQALVFQWFVELYRKFNLSFTTIDNEKALKDYDGKIDSCLKENNKFIISEDLLKNNSWLNEIYNADFDMLIIDEAHHLDLNVNRGLCELIIAIKHIVLITATPTEFGENEHFTRLKLLDPDRFSSYEKYLKEKADYFFIGNTVKKILAKQSLSKDEEDLLNNFYSTDKANVDGEMLLQQVADCLGTSRLFFRNSRKNIKGFSQRKFFPYNLPCSDKGELLIKAEWFSSFFFKLAGEKVLLIVSSIIEAKEIAAHLREKYGIQSALFHEELSLIERDRNAAWFCDPEGVKVIICSEIGSEGRNFQISANLVMWDLPKSLGLIEQRIGRIDRIGQKGDVNIHLPVISESDDEFFMKWLNEGVNIFTENFSGLEVIEKKFLDRVNNVILLKSAEQLEEIINETAMFKTELSRKLDAGQDYLLERNSFEPLKGNSYAAEIKEEFAKPLLEEVMLAYWDMSGVTVEKLDKQTYLLNTSLADPDCFPADVLSVFEVTFSYFQAMEREDTIFLSYDHPLVLFALDYIMSSEKGDLLLTFTNEKNMSKFYLEIVYRLDCPDKYYKALGALSLNNSLRALINPSLQDEENNYSRDFIDKKTSEVPEKFQKEIVKAFEKILPHLLKEGEKKISMKAAVKIKEAKENLLKENEYELLRVKNIFKADRESLAAAEDKINSLYHDMHKAVDNSTTHLESIRLILKK